MRESIHHRDPDDAGAYVRGRVGLGQQRLSIIDLGHVVVPPSTPPLATLAKKVAVGAAWYAGALWLLFRERVLALVRVAMQLR